VVFISINFTTNQLLIVSNHELFSSSKQVTRFEHFVITRGRLMWTEELDVIIRGRLMWTEELEVVPRRFYFFEGHSIFQNISSDYLKYFTVMEEVNRFDILFIFVYDCLNTCYLFIRIEFMTFCEVWRPWLARLTIVKDESKRIVFVPKNLLYLQAFIDLQIFAANP
jgi:hypothetical protein